MKFEALVHHLSLLRRRERSGYMLEDLDQAMKRLSAPLQVIAVAGTNGKGSASTKMAAALQESGYRVGLFTSPHLFSATERIALQGESISEEKFCDLYEAVKSPIPFTFFDTLFLMALHHFSCEKVDFAVFEAGIGARLDPVGLLSPILSILTTIGYDHREILGHSLREIAFEKSFIIHPRVPVVIGPKAYQYPLIERAVRLGAPLYFAPPAPGDYTLENEGIARTALRALDIPLSYSERAIQKRPPLRFYEVEREGKRIVFDVAHNEEGFLALRQKLGPGPFEFVVGFTAEHKVASFLAAMGTCAAKIHVVAGEGALIHPDQAAFESSAIPHRFYEKAQEAIEAALSSPHPLCVTGSFYLMERLKPYLGSIEGVLKYQF